MKYLKNHLINQDVINLVLSCIAVLCFVGMTPVITSSNEAFNFKGEQAETIRTLSVSNIQNTVQPHIRINAVEPILTTNSKIEFQADTNREIRPVSENVDMQLLSQDDFYTYLIRVEPIPVGDSLQQIELVDHMGNTLQIKLKVSREQIFRDNTIPESTSTAIVASGNDLTAVVDKRHRLPQSYVPGDLVWLSDYGIEASSRIQLRRILIEDLQNLFNDIESEGLDIMISSGYRSYSLQISTYNYWLNYNKGNVEKTDAVSARPGHSEHQLGTTIDFVNSETNYRLSVDFGKTKAGVWLVNNAYKYGFALSYPNEKSDITGYSYEPWHWRYIGKDHALKWYHSSLTLVEYLESISR